MGFENRPVPGHLIKKFTKQQRQVALEDTLHTFLFRKEVSLHRILFLRALKFYEADKIYLNQ